MNSKIVSYCYFSNTTCGVYVLVTCTIPFLLNFNVPLFASSLFTFALRIFMFALVHNSQYLSSNSLASPSSYVISWRQAISIFLCTTSTNIFIFCVRVPIYQVINLIPLNLTLTNLFTCLVHYGVGTLGRVTAQVDVVVAFLVHLSMRLRIDISH